MANVVRESDLKPPTILFRKITKLAAPGSLDKPYRVLYTDRTGFTGSEILLRVEIYG
jgi:hypothetical protein